MARPTDQEMTSLKKLACYTHRFQNEGGMPYYGGVPWESTKASQGAEGMKGKCG